MKNAKIILILKTNIYKQAQYSIGMQIFNWIKTNTIFGYKIPNSRIQNWWKILLLVLFKCYTKLSCIYVQMTCIIWRSRMILKCFTMQNNSA